MSTRTRFNPNVQVLSSQNNAITPEASPQPKNEQAPEYPVDLQDSLFISPSESEFENDDSLRSGTETERPRRNLMYEKLVRPLSESKPMRLKDRLAIRVKRWCGREEPESREKSEQYRIPPREEKRHRLEGVFDLLAERKLETLTHFYFRSNFTTVMFVFLLFYFLCIWLFAGIIHLTLLSYVDRGRDCLTGWEAFDDFEIAFALSWTTFSTVGFGTVSPPNEEGCVGLRYLLAIEAFFGVLYAGFCGAIWYSKIARIHSSARVTFSSAMCLQFGAGVTETPLDVKSSLPLADVLSPNHEEEVEALTHDEYPILEMRVVNDRAGFDGGEIIDASIRCMLSHIRLEDDSLSGRLSLGHSVVVTHHAGETFRSMRRFSVPSAEDDSSSRIPVKKRIYQSLKVVPDTHPYFRSAWYFRHTLDEHSPLLKPAVRRRIAMLGGFPHEINNYASIKNCLLDSLSACEILIIFNGTSDLTADKVFKTHRYRMEDLFVGWRFAKMNFLPEKKSQDEAHQTMELDMSLIHDIQPQDGGGNEPIGHRADETYLLGIPRVVDDGSRKGLLRGPLRSKGEQGGGENK